MYEEIYVMANAVKRHKKTSFENYTFQALAALELLMSFTFLGYIHIEPISITIAYIPIIIAGCLLGVREATFIGFLFGLSSMYKASASYVMSVDMMFSPFHSGEPLRSLILSVGVRTLYGFLIGAAFELARRSRFNTFGRIVIAALATKLQAVLVYTAMDIMFPQLGYSFRDALGLGFKDLLIALFCVLITEGCYRLYNSRLVNKYRYCIDKAVKNPYMTSKVNLIFFIFEIFIFIMTVAATVYFSQRTSYMLERHGLVLSTNVNNDLLHLQVQFMIAAITLNYFAVLLLMCIYRYMSYREYVGELDALTEIMGRRMFMQYCSRQLSENPESVWFLFIDVDYFKSINDTYGHPTGDKVLKGIAIRLKNLLSEYGMVGRVGGDEFAAFLDRDISKEELGRRLDGFLADIADILEGTDTRVSCSIGARQFMSPDDVNVLMLDTDKALYRAKEQGRACYVIEVER